MIVSMAKMRNFCVFVSVFLSYFDVPNLASDDIINAIMIPNNPRTDPKISTIKTYKKNNIELHVCLG